MIDFPDRQAGADVKGAIDWLKACPYVDAAKVGAVGFSFGARCIMLACHVRLDVAASVHYYPVLIYPFLSDSRPRQPLTFLPEMPHPTQVFFGDEDALVPATHVTFFRDLLRGYGTPGEFFIYPGVGHGFFNDMLKPFDPQASEDAWRKTLAFLNQRLKG